MDTQKAAGFLERAGTAFDSVRNWGGRVWRIGLLMTKGAYLVGERKKLFYRLGQEVYSRCAQNKLQLPELEPLIHQLDRLTKKVEIEEVLIHSLRFGSRPQKTS